MTTVLASQVRIKDKIILDMPSRAFECTVAGIEQCGKKFGTDIPVLRFTFSDAPRVVKALEIASDQLVGVIQW